MKYASTIGFIIPIWLALIGCSGVQTLSNVVWTAQPESREVDNPLFLAEFEPQKREYPYYASFLLTLTNKSDADLIVDWNASRYLIDGRSQGVFVFEGVDPTMVKNATIPAEAVAPGAVFSREIMPLRLIAWSPIKEKTTTHRSISPGILPVGENGIRLAIRHNGEQMTIPLSIRIVKEEAQ
jgi:hypothetical protein